jgi:hypothetical protein
VLEPPAEGLNMSKYLYIKGFRVSGESRKSGRT